MKTLHLATEFPSEIVPTIGPFSAARSSHLVVVGEMRLVTGVWVSCPGPCSLLVTPLACQPPGFGARIPPEAVTLFSLLRAQ